MGVTRRGFCAKRLKRESDKARSKAWHDEMKRLGLCHRCHQPSGRFWYCLMCRRELSRMKAMNRMNAERGAIAASGWNGWGGEEYRAFHTACFGGVALHAWWRDSTADHSG